MSCRLSRPASEVTHAYTHPWLPILPASLINQSITNKSQWTSRTHKVREVQMDENSELLNIQQSSAERLLKLYCCSQGCITLQRGGTFTTSQSQRVSSEPLSPYSKHSSQPSPVSVSKAPPSRGVAIATGSDSRLCCNLRVPACTLLLNFPSAFLSYTLPLIFSPTHLAAVVLQ